MKVRLSKEDKIRLLNSDAVYKIMQKILLRQNALHRQKEYFWVIGLNTKNDILYIELVSIGVLNQINLDPVEIFSFAVSKKCKKIILVHNHPSGDLKPSKADIALTKELERGAIYLKIEILDHLIIAEEKFFSFKDEGLIR
jgi:DNA repair protein RadC